MTFVPVVVERSIKNVALLRKLIHGIFGTAIAATLKLYLTKTLSLGAA